MGGLLKGVYRIFFYLFNTAIGGEILIYSVVYLVVGAFWALIFQLEFPDLQGNGAFASSLTSVEIVLGFVYFIWLRLQLFGYIDSVKEYAELIERIERTGVRLFAEFDGIESDRENAWAHVRNMKAALQWMIFYCYKIYVPTNNDLLEKNPSEARRVEMGEGRWKTEGELALQSDLEDVGEAISRKRDVYLISGAPERLLEISELDGLDACRRAELFLFQEFSHLSDHKFYEFVDKQISAITEKTIAIAVNRAAEEPGMGKFYVGFVLLAYFGVWLPIVLWVRFGLIAGPIIYAIVLYFLTSPMIYRRWMGNAFSSTRPISEPQHETWRYEKMQYLEELFWREVRVERSDARTSGSFPASSSSAAARDRGGDGGAREGDLLWRREEGGL